MKIKSLFGIFALTLAFTSCTEAQLNLEGNITGFENSKLLVSKIENNQPVAIDTVAVDSLGKFTYTEKLSEESIRLFSSMANPRLAFVTFLGNDKVTVLGSSENIREVEVSGSKSQDLYNDLMASIKSNQEEKNNLYQEANVAYSQNDSLKLESLKDAIEQNDKKLFNILYDFAEKNNSSLISPIVLNNFIDSKNFDPAKASKIYESYSQEIKNSTHGVELAKKIENTSKLAVGATPPDFTLKTTEGETFTLSAQTGKVVLVDFWASWCNPCRKENPNNVKLYAKYAADGFVIAAISVDKDNAVDKWKQAIEDDGLTYTQMRDTADVAMEYQIQFIPTTYLIGKDGKIIAKNLRGKELEDKLAEIFGK